MSRLLATILLFSLSGWSVKTDYLDIERAKVEVKYKHDLLEYKRQAESYKKIDPFTRLPASISKANLKIKKFKNIEQYAGMIFFKKGDLDKSCKDRVDRIKAYGFNGIAFFYPVHYSGGNSSNYKMPKSPAIGKHYRFEHANRPGVKELNRCLSYISDSGLKLHYIPHLESISQLVRPDSNEWRLEGGIPLDTYYHSSAFGPLYSFLYYHKNSFRKKGDLKITVFAEIDPLVLSDPESSINVINELKNSLSELNLRNTSLYYNTNGDFYNGWNIPQVQKKIKCSQVGKLLEAFDGFTPSIYGEKGHIGYNSSMKASYKSTIELYTNRFEEKLSELCPQQKIKIPSEKVNFGEFALDLSNTKQNYRDFFNDEIPSNSFVQFWSHSKWDHHGIYQEQNRPLVWELFETKTIVQR